MSSLEDLLLNLHTYCAFIFFIKYDKLLHNTFRAQACFDKSLEKYSDFNHTKKNFNTRLFNLRKEKKDGNLDPKAINHRTKCFAHAVKLTDDEDTLKNLTDISLHVFGDHSHSSEWCG